jgi:hypothetical protein
MTGIFKGVVETALAVAKTKKNMTSVKVNSNPFIRNKGRVISSEGFTALEKKHHDMSSEGCAAHTEQKILI